MHWVCVVCGISSATIMLVPSAGVSLLSEARVRWAGELVRVSEGRGRGEG